MSTSALEACGMRLFCVKCDRVTKPLLQNSFYCAHVVVGFNVLLVTTGHNIVLL